MNAKRILVLFTICMVSFLLKAQESTQNYLSEKRYLDANATSSVHTVNYHDGLGRPYLSVKEDLQGNTGTLQKQHTWQRYDEQGRVSRTYLPYAVTNSYHSLVNVNALYSLYNDSKAYVDYSYENRSDGRIISVKGPGSVWDNHAQTTSYLTNSSASSSPLYCKRYTLNSDYSLSSGNYTAGSLSVVQHTDEDGNTAYTFTDRQGRTMLERVMNGTDSLDTYYIYDDFGNLCYVLQPMYQSIDDLSKYAYRYRYDEHNRCIEKKLPGAEPIKYVYDKVGHLTFSQDGKQLSERKCTFYLYDRHNRLAVQGEIETFLPPLIVNQTVTAELIDNNLLAVGQIPGTRYYSNLSLNNAILHQVNYYDNYDFRSLDGFRNMSFELNLVGRPGKLTGSQTADLSSEGGFRYTQYFYNEKGELQRQVCRYPDEYIETRTYTYSFTGQPLQETIRLDNDELSFLNSKTYANYTYQYSYDALDRCSRIDMVQGGNTVTLVSYTYDGVGRMTAQSFHGGVAGTMTYGYNVRGWTTSIGSTGNKFTQTLTYNNDSIGFNGNITAMSWTANGQSHAYSFTYDGANRMLNAAHGNNRYTEKVTEYDKNGNIKKLQRYGQTGASSYGLVDNLTYTYNGNQLTKVEDAVTATSYTSGTNFVNGSTATTEYTYDNNGNLTKDLNKGISNIQYNVLNLPNEVLFDNGATQTYHYTADGEKWRTVYMAGMLLKDTVDYCGGAIIENGVLKKLLTPVGYVDMSGSTPSYYYYLKDHQGNNRVVVNSSGSVVETNHYYPFGGLFATNGSVQDYKYNGKELDNRTKWYDYGARHYDATLARWHVIDPLAEKMGAWSPYGYCYNNPMRYIDPDGQDGWDVVVGYGIGILTNIIPGTGNLRDVYTPADVSDYNGALRGADNISMAVGAGMVADGGKRTLSGISIATAGAVMTVGSGGTLIEAGVPVIVVGSTQAGVGAVEAATGGLLMYNAASNSKDGYERGKQSNVSSGNKKSPHVNQKAKSINQLQKEVEKGKAPKGIERFDNAHDSKTGQPHVHFKDTKKSALNRDGSWKEGYHDLNKKEKEYLKKHGWNIEK